jgi:hypothetical protein
VSLCPRNNCFGAASRTETSRLAAQTERRLTRTPQKPEDGGGIRALQVDTAEIAQLRKEPQVQIKMIRYGASIFLFFVISFSSDVVVAARSF